MNDMDVKKLQDYHNNLVDKVFTNHSYIKQLLLKNNGRALRKALADDLTHLSGLQDRIQWILNHCGMLCLGWNVAQEADLVVDCGFVDFLYKYAFQPEQDMFAQTPIRGKFISRLCDPTVGCVNKITRGAFKSTHSLQRAAIEGIYV